MMARVGTPPMPASYVIDKHRRLVITTASGVLTFQDCVQHQDRLIEDPDFDQTYNQLLDFFEVTSIQLDELAIRFLMVRHVFSGQSRRAVIGSGMQFEAFAKKAIELRKEYLGAESARVFSDREEALRWLAFGD
jgi:hypothetical protein